mmetsp:Transcript_1514/g.4577  ORF Transcript_1514/g.4577 Transcript_1514/m.4577 type:complete len:491 (-) Transcript_1514:204-1676(-)
MKGGIGGPPIPMPGGMFGNSRHRCARSLPSGIVFTSNSTRWSMIALGLSSRISGGNSERKTKMSSPGWSVLMKPKPFPLSKLITMPVPKGPPTRAPPPPPQPPGPTHALDKRRGRQPDGPPALLTSLGGEHDAALAFLRHGDASPADLLGRLPAVLAAEVALPLEEERDDALLPEDDHGVSDMQHLLGRPSHGAAADARGPPAALLEAHDLRGRNLRPLLFGQRLAGVAKAADENAAALRGKPLREPRAPEAGGVNPQTVSRAVRYPDTAATRDDQAPPGDGRDVLRFCAMVSHGDGVFKLPPGAEKTRLDVLLRVDREQLRVRTQLLHYAPFVAVADRLQQPFPSPRHRPPIEFPLRFHPVGLEGRAARARFRRCGQRTASLFGLPLLIVAGRQGPEQTRIDAAATAPAMLAVPPDVAELVLPVLPRGASGEQRRLIHEAVPTIATVLAVERRGPVPRCVDAPAARMRLSMAAPARVLVATAKRRPTIM